ncbi:MAG TPA: hypothetical protein VGO73_00630 [Pyrinomonadaceae bacterium]|jgi:hypothetical protein|nr:hypothetical protein [Pyrinomonadaceae bacterium]
MRRSRWILLFAALVLALIAIWLWWVRPKKVDMAAYAPADSLIYLEANRPLEVFEAIAGTDGWKALEKGMGTAPSATRDHWLQSFLGWTGLGPAQSVILARAQIAVVVTGLGTTEAGDTLKVKSEGAILIETHTGESRIRPPFEKALKALAEKTYHHSTARRNTIDGVEFIEWIAPEGSRQIVGTVAGSLLIIGTSEHVVQSCLAVAQGRRPALKDDPELNQMREQLQSNSALSFGYVPAGNSARLLAVGIPVLLGRAPGDSEFQRLITNGAAKVFGSVAWSSRGYRTGIEDRYLINLQPAVVARLKPHFSATSIPSQIQQLVPSDVYSVTAYRFADPSAAWQSLKTAISSQVDALSTIVFSSLLKSALLSYGIDDPETFLRAVNGELLTLRFDENAERSILIAGVRDRASLRSLISRKMLVSPRSSGEQNAESFEDAAGDFAARLTDEFVVVGAPADVRRYAETRGAGSAVLSAEKYKQMTSFASASSKANVVTCTNDESRVRDFFAAITAAKGARMPTSSGVDEAVSQLPYSITETTLGDRGLERTTRSPLGQFSTLLPLLIPEQPAVTK